MADDKKQELRETAANMLPDPVLTLAYIEHQMDLIGRVVLDLAEDVTLTPEKKQRLDMLKSVLEHSSINFENITDMMQSYKIPKTIENKQRTRIVQQRYLLAQVKAGLF